MNTEKLKSLSIPYNGIEQEFCEYFKHMFNFKTLESLDLSANWFGIPGITRFNNFFQKFENLKMLSLRSNKLCADEEADRR